MVLSSEKRDKIVVACWSSGMILVSGTRGPEFDSRVGPLFVVSFSIINRLCIDFFVIEDIYWLFYNVILMIRILKTWKNWTILIIHNYYHFINPLHNKIDAYLFNNSYSHQTPLSCCIHMTAYIFALQKFVIFHGNSRRKYVFLQIICSLFILCGLFHPPSGFTH